jgi:DNA-binding MurR/RpiR family transcriptional regulator
VEPRAAAGATEPLAGSGPLSRVRLALPELSDALRTCAELVLGRSWEARGPSIHELAARSGASTHAVNRFSRRVGYSGYHEFSQVLTIEFGRIQGAADGIPEPLAGQLSSDTGEAGDGAAGVAERVLMLELAARQDTLRALDADAIGRVVRTIEDALRVLEILDAAADSRRSGRRIALVRP